MSYERNTYKTYDGTLKIDFVFYYGGSSIGWRIYIINSIDYKGRDTSFHKTHRLHFEKDTYPCVCWKGILTSLEQARAVASFWADVTAEYIKSGNSFDTIAGIQTDYLN